MGIELPMGYPMGLPPVSMVNLTQHHTGCFIGRPMGLPMDEQKSHGKPRGESHEIPWDVFPDSMGRSMGRLMGLCTSHGKSDGVCLLQ